MIERQGVGTAAGLAEGARPTNTLIAEFWNPDCEKKFLLYKASHAVLFVVTVAQEKPPKKFPKSQPAAV